MSDFRYFPRGVDGGGFHHLSIQEMNDILINHPWDFWIEPFRVAPHVWYVAGMTDVSSYLLDTGDGLILIDTPAFATLYLQLESIRRVGYDPRDIKWIFLTHAHGDHYGGLRPMQEYTGAKVFMPKADKEDYDARKAVVSEVSKEMAKAFGCFDFEPDEFYDDDKPLKLGRFEIRTRTCPGHTPGATAFFFEDTDEDGTVYKCAMHGGVGATAGTETLKRLGYPLWMHDKFISDCEEMAKFDVDICLASHENQTNFLSGVNEADRSDFSGFVDKDVWKNLMLGQAEAVRKLG